MKAKLNDPVSKAHSEQFERFVLAVLKVRTSSFYVKNWQYGAFVLRFESEYANNKQKSQPLSDWLFPSWGTRTRTKNDRTRICSVTITPYPNVFCTTKECPSVRFAAQR